MISKLAEMLTQKLSCDGIVPSEEEEIYAYGFELLFSVALNILCVLVISLLFEDLIGGLLFLLSFIPLRTFAGGYHAKTHWGCTLTFVTVFLLSNFVVPVIEYSLYSFVSVVIAVASMIIIYSWAPVDSNEKPLDDDEKKINKARAMILCKTNIVIAVIICFAPTVSTIAIKYFLGVLSAALSVSVVQIIQKKELSQ